MKQPHDHIATTSSFRDRSHPLRDLGVLLFKIIFQIEFGTEGRKDREVPSQRRWLLIPLLGLLFAVILCSPVFAGPRIDIVIGEKAPALERLAADELAGQLKRVYDADVKIDSKPPADSPHVIFVGSPDTNASMKPFAATWPSGDKKLTDQGHLLKSVTFHDRPALLIGGGSPVATFWAVAEYGHRLGIRSMLFGDLDPVSPPPFTLNDIAVVMEPNQRERGWEFALHDPMEAGAFSRDDFRKALRQLAKLKFNRVSIEIDVGGPFVHFEVLTVKRKSAALWNGATYPVAGDTAGRKVFGGAKFFEHQAFAGATTYEQQIAAGTKLLNGFIDDAHDVGQVANFVLYVTGFPIDFEAFSPQKVDHDVNGTSFLMSTNEFGPFRAGSALAIAQASAYVTTYPKLDQMTIDLSFTVESEACQVKVFSPESAFWKRRDGTVCEPRLKVYRRDDFIRISSRYPVNGGKLAEAEGAAVLLAWKTADAVPYGFSRLVKEFRDSRAVARDGFHVRSANLCDPDLPAYWLSRVSFDDAITFEEACRDVVDSACGEGVADRFLAAINFIEKAGEKYEQHKLNPVLRFGFVESRVPHIHGELWSMMSADYANAMNEMYRANTRAREGGRALTLYWARKCEFAMESMNCLDAFWKSGLAAEKKDSTTEIAELEKAIESLNNGLNAMAAVARSNSDRGLIAELNEYGYRPLKKKLAEAEEAK